MTVSWWTMGKGEMEIPLEDGSVATDVTASWGTVGKGEMDVSLETVRWA